MLRIVRLARSMKLVEMCLGTRLPLITSFVALVNRHQLLEPGQPEELERTLGQVAAAESRMGRFGRDREQFQLPNERRIVACLVLETAMAAAQSLRQDVRASLERVTRALPAGSAAPDLAGEIEHISGALDRNP